LSIWKDVSVLVICLCTISLALMGSAHANKIALNHEWTYPLDDWTYDVDVTEDGSRVVALNRAQGLLCLDGQGRLLGKYKPVGQLPRSAFITKDENLVVSSWGSSFQAYLEFTTLGCSHVGSLDLGEHVLWQPDANADGSKVAVIVNPLDDDFNVINGTLKYLTRQGQLLWSKQLPGEPWLVRHSTGLILVGTGTYLDYLDTWDYIYRGESAVLAFDEQGNELWRYSFGIDFDKAILDIAISESPRRIAVGTDDRNMYFFSEAGELLWNHYGGGYVAISQDAQVIVSASLEGYVLDKDGNEIFVTQSGWMDVAALSKDGSVVAFGGTSYEFDNDVVEVFFSNGTEVGSANYPGMVEDVELTLDGTFVVVSSKNIYGYSLGTKAEQGDVGIDPHAITVAILVVLVVVVSTFAIWRLQKRKKKPEETSDESYELNESQRKKVPCPICGSGVSSTLETCSECGAKIGKRKLTNSIRQRNH